MRTKTILLLLFCLAIWNAACNQDRNGDHPSPYLGAPPQPVLDSEVAPDHESPRALLASLLEAAQREDFACIARCQSPTAKAYAITISDMQRARRDWGDPNQAVLRKRLRAALDAGSIQSEVRGDTATLRVHVGGALSTVTMAFVKINERWYQRTLP